jgi:tape measure domain-containing protein
LIVHIDIEILPQFKSMNEALKKGVEQSLRGVRSQIQKVSDDTHKMVEQTSSGVMTRIASVGAFAGNLAAQGVASMTRMAAGAVAAGFQTAAGMEQAGIAFSTLLHSTSQAQSFLGQLKTFAARTPFEIPGLIDASRQLLGVGMKAKDVIPTLTAYGDASGALGISQDGFNHIMLATTQAMSAGTLHAGDLLQMTEAGLPVWKLLSEALHKPVAALKDMSEKGKLISADVLPKLQAQMEKDYGGAMGKQAMTLSGLWSTLMDTMHQGEADALIPMEPLMRGLIPKAADIMGRGFKTLGTGTAQFFTGLSGNVKRMSQDDRPKLELFGLGLHAMFAAFKSGDTTSKGFVGVMERVGVVLRSLVSWVGHAAQIFMVFANRALTGMRDAFMSVWPLIRSFGQFLNSTVIPAVMKFASMLAGGLGGALRSVGGWMKDHGVLVRALVTGFLAAYAALKLWTAATKVWAVIQKGLIALQLAWDAAMDANPIGIIILAVVALTAAFIYAYKHSKTFRDIVADVGHVCARVGKDIYQFFINLYHVGVTVWHALETAGEAIGAFFGSLWSKLVQAWNKVVKFLGTWGPIALKILFSFITIPIWIFTHFDKIKDFLKTVWDNAYHAVVTGVLKVLIYIGGLELKILHIFANAARWLVSKGVDIVTGIKTGTANGWHIVTDWFSKILRWIGNAIGDAGKWAKGVGGSIINGLLNGLKSVWDTVTGWFGKIPGWIKSALGIHSPPAWAVDAGSWIIKALVKGLIGGTFSFNRFLSHFAALAKSKLSALAHSVGGGFLHPTGALRGWIEMAEKLTGVNAAWTPGLLTLIGRESGGNPNAINRTDSNAQRGDPSRGLMQTIGSTFSHYHMPGTSWDIYDPVANISAGIRYILSRYGDIGNVQQADPTRPPLGYATGAWRIPRDQLAYLHAREMVVPAGPADAIRANAGTSATQKMDLTDDAIKKLGRAIGREIGRALVVNTRQYG